MTGKTTTKRTPKEEAANRLHRMLSDLVNMGWDFEDEYDDMTPADKERYRTYEDKVYAATEKILAPILDRLDKVRAPDKNEED